MEQLEKEQIRDILNCELELATGCTEPAAIAFTAAAAARRLKEPAARIRVLASGNIIKNAMSAGIPGTTRTGIAHAAAIGALGGDPARLLRVIDSVNAQALRQAGELVSGGKVTVDVADVPEKLYIDVTLSGASAQVRAVVSGSHTGLIRIEENGKTVWERGNCGSGAPDGLAEEIQRILSLEKIYRYCTELNVQTETPEMILKCMEINSAICADGLINDYGLRIGKTLDQNRKKGILGDDIVTGAMILTSAGADARMAGAPLPVVSNSGSGNQGITATMPVIACAQHLGASREDTIRAVALSNLTAIYIKSKFGRLSALCGATVAATGAACGVTMLLGGGLREIGYAVQSMVGDIAGMLCDGAKADCALKISTCVNAAMQTALMAVRGIHVQSTDGIVESSAEKTIDNFAMLGREGYDYTDRLVLRMMLDKDMA